MHHDPEKIVVPKKKENKNEDVPKPGVPILPDKKEGSTEKQIDRNKTQHVKYTPDKITRPKTSEEKFKRDRKNETDLVKNRERKNDEDAENAGPSGVKGQGQKENRLKSPSDRENEDLDPKTNSPQLLKRDRKHFTRQNMKKKLTNIGEDENGEPTKMADQVQDDDKGGRRSRIDLDDYGWNCKVCTYLNAKELLKCEMCFAEKPDLSRRLPKQRLSRKRQLCRGAKSIKIQDREKMEEREAKERWIKIVNFCHEVTNITKDGMDIHEVKHNKR